jgi:C-5 cytosine-specific DNA methylase
VAHEGLSFQRQIRVRDIGVSSQPLCFYEFFAGGGMARLGLGRRWSCAFANDFDPVKASTYRANFADAACHLHEGDVWALSAAGLNGRADLARASGPCQDISLARGRAGLAGGRPRLFGFWRLIEGLAAQGRAQVDRHRTCQRAPHRLPDSYSLPRAATSALHVTGDGVAVPVVGWRARELLEPLLASASAIAAE